MDAIKRISRGSTLIEVVLVLGLMVVLTVWRPELKTAAALIPLAYLLVERRLRKRSWEEVGFRFKSLKRDLKANWPLVLWVGVVNQVAVLGVAKFLWPDLLAHVSARVTGILGTQAVVIFGALIFTTLMEELIYRALFQERLGWVLSPMMATLGVSILFGLLHWSGGVMAVVLADVGLIVGDSLIYGWIFQRGKNVLVAWLAHLLADVVGMAGLLWLV